MTAPHDNLYVTQPQPSFPPHRQQWGQPQPFMEIVYDPDSVRQFHYAKKHRASINTGYGILIGLLVIGGVKTFGILWALMIPVGIMWLIHVGTIAKPVAPHPIGYRPSQQMPMPYRQPPPALPPYRP